MSEQFDVFISHSHKDEARARRLAGTLDSWGFSVYVDVGDVVLAQIPSAELADRLISKLRRCRLLVFAFSEEATSSRWMPWELGLAHGVIGRVVLWPFTKKALTALATQEYLHLYEILEPKTARERLDDLLGAARDAAVRPADLRMMQDLAAVTAAKLPEFNKPAVATEFMTYGPMQLYSAWMEALLKLWQPK